MRRIFLALLVTAMRVWSADDLLQDFQTANQPITSTPVVMGIPVDQLCGVPTEQMLNVAARNPHHGHFATIQGNKVGADAALSTVVDQPGTIPVFPVGSVIVKRKTTADGTVELFTVMRKRTPGYNPTCGDWEFAVITADGTRVAESGTLTRCMECHQDYAATGYLSRSYRQVAAKPAATAPATTPSKPR